MFRRAFAVGTLLAMAAIPARAQLPLLDLRAGLHGALPQGDFADSHQAGAGAYFRAGVPLLIVKLMGSVTYTQFKAADPFVDDIAQITMQAGPHVSPLPLLDIGAELGYLTDSEEFAFTPNVSVSLLMLEATASYNKPFDRNARSWVTFGVGLRF